MKIFPGIDAQDALFAVRHADEDWPAVFAFRDRPQFLDSVALYAQIMAPFYAHNVVLNKVVTEAWRFQMLVFALHLHDTRDPSDPFTGLTVSNLQRICARQGIASAGRALAYLNIMQLGGYLTRSRSALHRSVVHYVPTAMFMATVEQWNDGIFRLIDAVVPEDGLLRRRADYPEMLGREMRRRSAERLLAGWTPLAAFPEVNHFVASDGGWILLANMIARGLDSGFGAPLVIDLDALGKQAGVSRSHLRRLLEAAFAAGLLDAPPRNGACVMPSTNLVRAYLAWLASYLELIPKRGQIL